MNRIRVAAGVAAVGAVAVWLAARSGSKTTQAVEQAARPETAVEAEAGAAASGLDTHDSREPGRRGASASSQRDEGDLSERWDDLAPPQRVREATRAFRRAVAAVDRGSHTAKNVAIAEAALSVLRPEMYSSADGRARHQALEADLDRAVEGLAPASPGASAP
jgi:hypothetical protein